jgi:potassium-transporting ATPase KdpC subunit
VSSKSVSRKTASTRTGSHDFKQTEAPSITSLIQEIRASVAAIFILGIVLCGAYPVVVWGLGQLAYPEQANGSLIERKGTIIGSSLIGQNFTAEGYFHPRPSAAGDNGYDAANSGGSNLGPLSQKLSDQVKERVKAFLSENNLAPGTKVPADAVTASGSGLDPHISAENAGLQAARVARARGIPDPQIRKLIGQFTEYPQLGFLGDPGVNVLKLNLALDAGK